MMTQEQSAAYVQAQAACAMIRAFGMVAENMQRQHRGESMAYTEGDFLKIIDDQCIGYNAVVGLFNEVTP